MDSNTEQVIRDYLPQILHMSLGTSKDNRPWVCEVHFVYDAQLNLYFRSLTSRRHSQEIAANPCVAGNIVRQHTVKEYPLGVYFEGTATILTSDAERQSIAPLFIDRLGASDTILTEAQQSDGHQFYKVTVKNWYVFGKFGEKAQKLALAWHGDEA